MRVKNSNFSIGGNLESALKGEYQIEVKAILKEGWQLTKNGKSVILAGIFLILFIAMICTSVAFSVLGTYDLNALTPTSRLLLDVSLTVLISPFIAAITMAGVSNSVGAVSPPSFLFYFVPRILILSVASVLVSAVVQLGIIFFVLPGLFLAMATSFTLPLLLDKGLTPARAMMISIKVVSFKWGEFAKIYGFFALLGLLVVVTLGVAIFWIAPFYFNVKGILYREVFGIQVKLLPAGSDKLKADNIFHA